MVWWSWKELILNSFYFRKVWWSLENWFWTVSTLGGCGGLEITDFEQFLLWEGVVVLKELILHQFLLWEGVVVLKELILNSFYFGSVCGGHERTDFEQFLLWVGAASGKTWHATKENWGVFWTYVRVWGSSRGHLNVWGQFQKYWEGVQMPHDTYWECQLNTPQV